MFYNSESRFWRAKRGMVLILTLLLLIGGGFLIYYFWQTPAQVVEEEVVGEKEKTKGKTEEFEKKTILFVGDIMLDRGVEYQMKKNSIFYPFEKINQFLKEADIVVGNLEGPIVREPKTFPAGSLMFAFSAETIEGLSFGGFNLLSLANNHTLNMGKEGLKETRELLKENNIDFVGDTILCSQDFSLEKENIIFLAINKTFPFNCEDEEIAETVQLVKSPARPEGAGRGSLNEIERQNPEKFLIVFMHWGNEYQFSNSFHQQKLAHKMIDAGADLIIGAHPHVVQNIEIYKGKLIFYSLGNFILDQYFSEDTQQGLAVRLELYPDRTVYRLFPIQSHLSQPFLMEKEKADEFLEALAQRSSKELVEEIKNGIIEKTNLGD